MRAAIRRPGGAGPPGLEKRSAPRSPMRRPRAPAAAGDSEYAPPAAPPARYAVPSSFQRAPADPNAWRVPAAAAAEGQRQRQLLVGAVFGFDGHQELGF